MKRPSFGTLELLVFCEGAGTLGAEIAGARLLAPWFGASTIVWANTIATVLVALAIGYGLGGRLADRSPRRWKLAAIIMSASALIAVVPFISRPLLHLAVTGLGDASATEFLGSLVAVAALLAVPLVLLGMVSPYSIRLKTEQLGGDAERAGRVAGRIFATSTVGSLLGTFSAALLLIPLVGTRRTFLTFATLMVLSALPLLGRRWWWGLVEVAVLAGLIALPVGVIKAGEAAGDAPGTRVLWEGETLYQYGRVIETARGTRYLELNEGQAVHSVYREGQYLTGGYWDDMMVGTLAGAGGLPTSVVNLGNSAGTVSRGLAHYLPRASVEGVEIDPDVTEVGRELFGLTDPRIEVHAADARPWLAASDKHYDAITVDAYRQPYIPFYLTTVEFFTSVREHLNPGGVLVLNCAQPEGSKDLEKVLTATMRAAGFEVWRDPATDTNTILMAVATATEPAKNLIALLTDRSSELDPDLRDPVAEAVARIAPGLDGGTVYTDDRAPVEWLVDLSLAQLAE